MRQLTPEELRQFREIVTKIFKRSSLDSLLQDRLDTSLDFETANDDFVQQVRQVLINANMEGWIYDLVLAATYERPNSDALIQFAGGLGLTAKSESSLELQLTGASFANVPFVRRRLFEIEQQVCQIELMLGGNILSGSGFLVGPDLVMTNYHVVESLVQGKVSVDNVKARFDYKSAQDGSIVYAGVEVGLSKQTPVEIYSPYDERDLVGGVLDDTWPADKLDFAILRLSTRIGEQPAGPMLNDSGAVERPLRGWIRAKEKTQAFGADKQITIVQHPSGEAIKMASDQATSWNKSATRVRYQTNTLHGSSGSPCFNSALDWVALHHCGDPAWAPKYNQGIPVSAIIAYLAAKGRSDLLK